LDFQKSLMALLSLGERQLSDETCFEFGHDDRVGRAIKGDAGKLVAAPDKKKSELAKARGQLFRSPYLGLNLVCDIVAKSDAVRGELLERHAANAWKRRVLCRKRAKGGAEGVVATKIADGAQQSLLFRVGQGRALQGIDQGRELQYR
jgi:hypothetical protein